MASLNYDIKDKLKRLNVIEKIIVANIIIFLLTSVLSYSGIHLNFLKLPSDFSSFIIRPWTIISYAFLHSDLWHVLFNMLWLYFLGQWFLNLFSTKMALNVYFLGSICGGLLFLLGYALLPSYFSGLAILVGASAAVRAMLIFLCAYMPQKELRFFTFSLKLWHLGMVIVVLDAFGILSGTNRGGNLAHFGGSILGYFYATQLHKGIDIGKGFEKLMDGFMSLFKSKSPLKTVHKSKSKKMAGYSKDEFNQFNNQKRIDIILDKISKSGYESLTKEEKEFLFKAGK
jgi:membrane associated rhomboid family serine protease